MSCKICWGVFRERAHSPGREFDDAEILRLTAKHLEANGFQVSLKSPDEISVHLKERPACLFFMCEQTHILNQFLAWEKEGMPQVNSPAGVFNTYRTQMLSLFQRDEVVFPDSVIIPTKGKTVNILKPTWIKRADVHNTQEGDVVFVTTQAQAEDALHTMANRGIAHAVIQDHIPGDLIKFYGIGDSRHLDGAPPWFQFFYHKDQQVKGFPFKPENLASLAQRAASSLGLEIYGGDAVATKTGELWIIDLNAWPSFALYRDEASKQIASYLLQRFASHT
jgi:hypothetical protein